LEELYFFQAVLAKQSFPLNLGLGRQLQFKGTLFLECCLLPLLLLAQLAISASVEG